MCAPFLRPLIIAQHGGGGNPKAICYLDTRINYRSFGREAVCHGYGVWTPALAMRSAFSGDPAIPGASRELLDQKLMRFRPRWHDRPLLEWLLHGALGHAQAIALICRTSVISVISVVQFLRAVGILHP
jgi:hypothetical protein